MEGRGVSYTEVLHNAMVGGVYRVQKCYIVQCRVGVYHIQKCYIMQCRGWGCMDQQLNGPLSKVFCKTQCINSYNTTTWLQPMRLNKTVLDYHNCSGVSKLLMPIKTIQAEANHTVFRFG